MLLFLTVIIGLVVTSFFVASGQLVVLCLTPAGILSIILIVVNYVFRSEQVNNLTWIDKLTYTIRLYEKQRAEMIPEIKKYLGELYPNIEKELFGKMSANETDLRIYMVKYPEIKSNETIKYLVDRIQHYSDLVVECEKDKLWHEQRLQARMMNARVWTFPGVVKLKY
jgi:hypothetical protein